MTIINSIKVELEEGLFTCYYPKYYAEWIVQFRTVLGKRTEKVLTFGDGLKNQQAIIDRIPDSKLVNVDDKEIMSINIDKKDFEENCLTTLKKHYMYRRRSFQIPEIELLKTSMIYVPYQIKNTKRLLSTKKIELLYEPHSKHYDKLKNYSVIQQFYKERRGAQ